MKAGDDNAVAQLIKDMNDGKVGALIMSGVNPSYTLADAEAFNAGLKKVSLTISTALSMDETSTNVEYVCPDRHYLESWGDAKATPNQVAFIQPTIQPLFDSRQIQESLLVWSGDDTEYYTYLKNYWRSKVSWSSSLHDGIAELSTDALSPSSFAANVKSVLSQAQGLELALYQSNSIGDGSQANNPWLQELPDLLQGHVGIII